MDHLQQKQQLNINDQLVSNNGRVNLIMQGDGNLVLYRTHFGRALWASNTWQNPVDHAVMQDDGNLVAYSVDGTPYWATGTNGHPGARVVLQDDGNLVIYDGANNPLWASNTVQNFLMPTMSYEDANGYTYVETSELWKDICSQLPCFIALQWPGYLTKVVEDRINGQDVVIQLWIGWCQKFLGLQDFPGGIGAEVGVYRRIPGKVRPTSLPFLPKPIETFILNSISTLSDNELWWPFPELNAQIEFTLTNPITNQVLFNAGPETSYWLAKWMNEPSYIKYQFDQGPGNTPNFFSAVDYLLDYKINGKSYPQWSVGKTSSGITTSGVVAAMTRNTDKLDIFAADKAEMVKTAAWEPSFADGWHGWWPVGNIRVPAGAPIHVVSRNTDKLDIFVTDEAGVIRTAAWEPAFTNGWHGWWEVAAGRAAPGAAVTAVSRSKDKLDVFVVGTDGQVWTAAWEPTFADGWHGWWPIGNIRVPAGTPIHVVSRNTDKLDIFVTDEAGVIRTAAWEPAFTDGWHGWWEVAAGRAAPGAALTAVSRGKDKLDLFVVGTDGRVWTAAWEPSFTDGWHGWWPIGNIRVPAGAPIHVVSRNTDKLDIFVTDEAGVIRTAAWEPAFTDGWHGWWDVAAGQAAPGTAVTAVSRGEDKLDVLVVGTDGRVWTAAWEPSFADGWHGWWPIG